MTRAIVAALALLALTGCGGGSEDPAAPPVTETVTAEAPDPGIDTDQWESDLAALGYTHPDMDALLDNVQGMCDGLEGERDAGYKISVAWADSGVDGVVTSLLGVGYVCPDQRAKMLRSIKDTDDYVDGLLGQQ